VHSGRGVANAETGESGVAEIAPSWSPRVDLRFAVGLDLCVPVHFQVISRVAQVSLVRCRVSAANCLNLTINGGPWAQCAMWHDDCPRDSIGLSVREPYSKMFSVCRRCEKGAT
jgi:hypothetical protein